MEEVEALVRWERYPGLLLAPRAFIPVAERTGAILEIGEWVLEEALRQLAEWKHAFPQAIQHLRVGVNLSAAQLALPDLTQRVLAALGRHQIGPSHLKIELTESIAIADTEHSVSTLRALRVEGVRLAMDDFGTGYSSLGYLRRFPFDTLKIDRSFVLGLGIPGQDEAEAVARAIVAVGHALGMTVTAEGIETAAQLAHLQALGADLGQGYFFSKAVPAAEMEEIFRIS